MSNQQKMSRINASSPYPLCVLAEIYGSRKNLSATILSIVVCMPLTGTHPLTTANDLIKVHTDDLSFFGKR
jgi:hypothetical protein